MTLRSECAVDRFPALDSIPFIRAAFISRCPGIAVDTDRDAAMERLRTRHKEIGERMDFAMHSLATVEQIHGNGVAHVVETPQPLRFSGMDALVTSVPGIPLGIYVADCAAVYFVDPVRKCIGLAHSGRKGTDLGIVPMTIEKMRSCCGTEPRDLVVQLSPCIRPPRYEIDFAAGIVHQARREGVLTIIDPGVCTGANLDRYYSYRIEKGRTGRMLALLEITG